MQQCCATWWQAALWGSFAFPFKTGEKDTVKLYSVYISNIKYTLHVYMKDKVRFNQCPPKNLLLLRPRKQIFLFYTSQSPEFKVPVAPPVQKHAFHLYIIVHGLAKHRPAVQCKVTKISFSRSLIMRQNPIWDFNSETSIS